MGSGNLGKTERISKKFAYWEWEMQYIYKCYLLSCERQEDVQELILFNTHNYQTIFYIFVFYELRGQSTNYLWTATITFTPFLLFMLGQARWLFWVEVDYITTRPIAMS